MQTNAVEHADQAEALRDSVEKFLGQLREGTNLEVQQRVAEHTQTIKADTDEIKETTRATLDVNPRSKGSNSLSLLKYTASI